MVTNQQLLLMSSAGGAVTSIDTPSTNTINKLGTNKNRKSRNKNSRRNRGEMKLLGKYLDELRRNKSFHSSPNDLKSESEFDSVFAESGVKIGTCLNICWSNYDKHDIISFHRSFNVIYLIYIFRI